MSEGIIKGITNHAEKCPCCGGEMREVFYKWDAKEWDYFLYDKDNNDYVLDDKKKRIPLNEDVIVDESCLDPIMDSMGLNEEGRKFYLEEMRKMLP